MFTLRPLQIITNTNNVATGQLVANCVPLTEVPMMLVHPDNRLLVVSELVMCKRRLKRCSYTTIRAEAAINICSWFRVHRKHQSIFGSLKFSLAATCGRLQ